jgi:TolB-like protein
VIRRIKQFFVVNKKESYKKKYEDAVLEVRQVEADHMVFVRQIESVLKEEKQRRVGARIIDPTKITGIPRV